jgi:predicted AlkP superfamily pyrophosphatase or phosphodiesterase
MPGHQKDPANFANTGKNLFNINCHGCLLTRRAPLIITLLAVFCMRAYAAGDFSNGSGGTNAPHQQDKSYLILVSIDGFRWDYMDRYPTPNLDRITSTGSRAERLVPVFPTLTFPNHYSIATGLYPAHHGLVANNFPDPTRQKWYALWDRESVEDPQFYAGEPIWVTAETQGMVAASYYFVGTEAAIKGVSPTHWRSYDDDISGEDRVDQVLSWLAQAEESRPHLLTLYFENVDDHSHWYGTDSAENIEAIQQVDSYIGRLLDGIEQLAYADKVNIIVVSDHGQGAYVEDQTPFELSQHVDLKDTSIVEGGSYLFLYLDQENPQRAATIVETTNRHWRHGRAYLPENTPGHWNVDDNPRFPDVILMPEPGYAVLSGTGKVGKINAGDHGWAPEAPDMHGFFIASGPDIKAGVDLGVVNNIDIYPLMISILGLESPADIDGDASRLAKRLKPDQ